MIAVILALVIGLSWFGGRTDDEGGVLVYPMGHNKTDGRFILEPMIFTGNPTTQDVIQRWHGTATSLRRHGHHTCEVETVKDWECRRKDSEGITHSQMINGKYFYRHPRGNEIVYPIARFAWNGYRWQEKLSTLPKTNSVGASIPWLALGLLFPIWA